MRGMAACIKFTRIAKLLLRVFRITVWRYLAHILDLPLCPPDRARSQKSFACISNKLSSEDLNAIIVSITDIDSSFLVHC